MKGLGKREHLIRLKSLPIQRILKVLIHPRPNFLHLRGEELNFLL